jgi:CubicO group peptidase (beta-lactamase class C family)
MSNILIKPEESMKLKCFYRTVTFICFLQLYFNSCFAQVDSPNLKLNGFDEYVEKVMKDWKTPGAAIAIVKDSKVVLSKGYGFRDVKNKLRVTPTTMFGLGSITKPFVSLSVGILSDEGKVDVDSPIIKYYPNFKLFDKYVTDHITLRDLLSHRTGLAAHDWFGLGKKSRKELIEKLQFLPLTKGFRETLQYNNMLFAVSSGLIEEINGKNWENYVHEKILGPLDMKRTCFSYKESQSTNDYSVSYVEDDGILSELPMKEDSILNPGGGLFSNVSEMSNWLIMITNNGYFNSKKIISESYLKKMITPNIYSSINPRFDSLFSAYGLGWRTTSYQGNLIMYHVGVNSGFFSHVIIQPENKIGIIILTNLRDSYITNILGYNILERFLNLKNINWYERDKNIIDSKAKASKIIEKENLEDERKRQATPAHLEIFAGVYQNPAYGEVRVYMENNSLLVNYGNIKSKLEYFYSDMFKSDINLSNKKFIFKTGSNEKINQISIPFESSAEDIIFTRIDNE